MATHTKNRWPLLTFLAWTVSVVRHVGYVPRSKAKLPGVRGGKNRPLRGTPTCQRVVDLLIDRYKLSDELSEENEKYPELREAAEKAIAYFRPEVEDTQKAVKVIAWAANLQPDQREESYFQNIHNLARQGDVTPQVAGLAASMPHAYDAAHKKEQTK